MPLQLSPWRRPKHVGWDVGHIYNYFIKEGIVHIVSRYTVIVHTLLVIYSTCKMTTHRELSQDRCRRIISTKYILKAAICWQLVRVYIYIYIYTHTCHIEVSQFLSQAETSVWFKINWKFFLLEESPENWFDGFMAPLDLLLHGSHQVYSYSTIHATCHCTSPDGVKEERRLKLQYHGMQPRSCNIW